MKNDIRCADCSLLAVRRRENGVARRGQCYCLHSEALAAHEFLRHQSNREAGFVAFTKMDESKPDIKTAPRWCPRRMMEEPLEISKIDAYRVIDTRRPLGLFFLKEGERYTGIDNRSGDAWTEEFGTKTECLKWLKGNGGRDE